MSVKAMTSETWPGLPQDSTHTGHYCSIMSSRWTQKSLDKRDMYDVIIFTGRAHAPTSTARFANQTPVASPPRHPQPPSGSRHPCAVSSRRLLRSRRSRPSQVRDAASGSRRPTLRQRVRRSLRTVPAILLPSPSSFSRGRIFRFASAQARATRRPQVDRRGHGVRRPTANSGCFAHRSAVGRFGPKAIPSAGASPQHSTPTTASKKNLLSPPATRGGNFETLQAGYETLRAQALNGARAPGLNLILHHGLGEWMQVCSCSPVVTTTAELPVTAAANPQLLPPGMRTEVVIILAGMFLAKPREATL